MARARTSIVVARIGPSLLPMVTLAAAIACGCGEVSTAPKPALDVAVTVTSDPGRAVASAEVQFNGKTIAKTNDKGLATLVLQGNEGDTYEVSIKCPAGFQSPLKGLTIPLHRLVDPSKKPEYEVSCPPTKRTIVIAVRAENGPNLAVLHLGRVVGRTDASGAATVLLKDLDADAQFELTLDTSENGALRPQNPTVTFSVKHADDVFAFDQKFTLESKPKVYWVGPKKEGPVKLPTVTHP